MQKRLTNNEYIGKVLPATDPKYQGRYKVHIPELMPHLSPDVGIWVKNHTHTWRITKTDENITYGQYYPLQPGTIVIVKFFEEDFNTGYIDRIVSDSEMNTMPFMTTERDDIYVLFKTARYNNLFVITEDTNSQPPKSIHLYYNNQRTTIIIDEQGLHLYTQDDINISVNGNCQIQTGGNCDITAGGDCNILASGNVNIDGSKINLNCGAANPQSPVNGTILNNV